MGIVFALSPNSLQSTQEQNGSLPNRSGISNLPSLISISM
jgi:hypothetical protein